MQKNPVKALQKKDSINSIMNRFDTPNIDIYIRRELNFLGRAALFGLYSLLVFVGGVTYHKMNLEENASVASLKKMQSEIKDIIAINSVQDNLRAKEYNEVLVARVEGKLSGLLENKDILAGQLLKEKSSLIKELEERNEKLDFQVAQLVEGRGFK